MKTSIKMTAVFEKVEEGGYIAFIEEYARILKNPSPKISNRIHSTTTVSLTTAVHRK